MRLAPLVLALALPAACASPRVNVPEAEQARAREALTGQKRFLRVAASVGPLWRDTDKLFVTELPAKEIDLVETPTGAVMEPPPFERVLPPGTPLEVTAVEFPSTWVMAQRVLATPRYHPWVYLALAGEKRPLVAVMAQTAATADEVRAELERLLTSDDPSAAFAALPTDVREAVLRKEAREGMSGRALEMAWGVPERKRVDRPAGTEEWIYPGDKRRAFLRDDRVEKLENP
jgi:hypothetical protein